MRVRIDSGGICHFWRKLFKGVYLDLKFYPTETMSATVVVDIGNHKHRSKVLWRLNSWEW